MWMDEPFGMFSVMDTLFPILFFGMFALIVVMFVVTLARGAVRWRRNNASPVLTVEAGVVAKRTQVSRSAGADHDMMGGFTSYYATFEAVSYTHLDVYKRQAWPPESEPERGETHEGRYPSEIRGSRGHLRVRQHVHHALHELSLIHI